MKKLFLSIALCACIAATSYAAPGKGKGDRQFRAMKELNLTSEQQQKVDAANAEFKNKMKDLKENKTLSAEDRKSKGKELMTEHRTQISGILTPEQQAKLKERRKDSRKGMKKGFDKKDQARRGDNKPGHKRGDNVNIMRQLNLTDAQKEQMKGINESYKNKQKDLQEQRKADFENILTADQKSKMQTLKTEKLAQRFKISTEGANKLQALKENYTKEKKAITMSRIAPDMQKTRLNELKDKFKTDRKQVLEQHRL